MRDVVQRKELGKTMVAISDLIKFGLKTHFGKDKDCVHDVNYAVLTGTVQSGETTKTSNCAYWLSLFELVRRIRECSGGSSPGL